MNELMSKLGDQQAKYNFQGTIAFIILKSLQRTAQTSARAPEDAAGCPEETKAATLLIVFQRTQVCGYSVNDTRRCAPSVLVSTGWMHMIGPDGSEGATIVDDADATISFVPMDLLAERVSGKGEIFAPEAETDLWYKRICREKP